MYYVIQENLFREFHFNTLIEHLKRYKLDYELVKYRPFVHEIDVKTDRKDVFFFGSVNAVMATKHKDWCPGIFYNDNHDFEKYSSLYGKNMLNDDAIIMDINDPYFTDLPYTFFARPSKDTKLFSGQVFTHDSWKEWVTEAKTNGSLKNIKEETKIVIAPVKSDIQQEIRCWMVDGEPITMSQYKIGKRVNMLNMDNNQEAYIFSKKMAKLYSPSRAYVLDICLYQDDYKVVEINCINCSGFYDLNMSKLLQSLEQTFGNGKKENS